MIRRAFTLLETIMAAAIGLIVVLTAVGVTSAINRADRTLAKRATEVAQLEVMHNIMSRAMTTLSMSDAPPPKQKLNMGGFSNASTENPAAKSAATRDEDAGTAAAAAEGRQDLAAMKSAALARATAKAASPTKLGSNQPSNTNPSTNPAGADAEGNSDSGDTTQAGPTPPDPRLILAPDARRDAPLILTQTGGRPPQLSPPQRFEVVLAKPPVPYPKNSGTYTQANVNAASDGSAGRAPLQIATKSFRGVFELIPDPNFDPVRMPGPTPHSLWWRPLPPPQAASTAGNTNSPDPNSEALPPPVKIADQLAYCHWEVFQQLQRRDQYQCVWAQDLPAYVTLEVQTVSGVYANWMFEVDWVVQPEVEQFTRTTTTQDLLLVVPTVSGTVKSQVNVNRGGASAKPAAPGGARQEPALRAVPGQKSPAPSGGRR